MNRRDAARYVIGPDFPLGAGALTATPGAYQIASNWDGRFNIPGPREVADLTGIDSGYRVYQMLRHADTPVVIASNGTDTRVFRRESGAWATKATISSRVPYGPQAAISFKNVLAVGFASGNPYQFTSDTGAGAWTFTASTKTAGNSEQAHVFLEQSNGLLTPRVVYMVSNELYYTEDLTNGDATGVNPSYVGDTSSSQTYATSLAEETGTGRLLIGMRHALYTLHQEPGPYEGIWERLTENFPDPISDAGGQSDRRNFESPALVGGTLYYPVAGYDLLAWRPDGTYDRYMAPRWVSDCKLPRMDLPINALAAAGGYLVAFLGSKNTATLKDVTYFPGGGAHLAATFTTTSDMWVGVPTSGRLVWHGVLLECGNPLRGAWFDEDDGYLYLFSGDSESADAQMTRCLFPLDNPVNRLTSSAVVLNAGTWQMEPGGLDFGDKWTQKRAAAIRIDALGLASTAPALEVEYKVTPDYDTAAFNSDFVTFTDESDGLLGAEFPEDTLFHTLHLRFRGTGTGNSYAVLRQALVTAAAAAEQDQLPRRR